MTGRYLFCSTFDRQPKPGPPMRGFEERAVLLNETFWGKGARLTIAFLEGSPDLHRRVASLAELERARLGSRQSTRPARTQNCTS